MKKITSISLTLMICLMSFSAITGVFAVSEKFDGLSAANVVTTQAEADALPTEINAIGYDIAVLVEGNDITLTGLTIQGATKYGIAVDEKSNVDVNNCEVYNIGTHTENEFTPNGAQYGIAIYYYASSGIISENTVYAYQKGGIIANLPCGDELVYILDNTVTGLGPVDFIAQNGIQLGWSQKGVIRGNTVSGNYYIDFEVPGKGKAIGQQTWVSCGILLYGVNAPEIKCQQNKLFDNQVQFYIYPVGL